MGRKKNPAMDGIYHEWVRELSLIDISQMNKEEMAERVRILLQRTQENSIRQRRMDCRMRQCDLANLLGVCVSTISAYERGLTSPTLDMLRRIADIFNCSLDEVSQSNWAAQRVRFTKQEGVIQVGSVDIVEADG